MSEPDLRVGPTTEIPLQASKWLSVQALIDTAELIDLFASLPSFSLYPCGTVTERNAGPLPNEHFIESYRNYMGALKAGDIPDIAHYRTAFSPAMTLTTEALYRVLVGTDKQIVRQALPVVQLQANTISYSKEDKKFHPMSFGKDSIAWGIQFSYPQLYLDPKTKMVEQVKDTPAFPNTKLFHAIQKWMRISTIPTPFVIGGVTVNAPIRLGKECLPWIDRHPQLIQNGIAVKTTTR